MTKAIQTENVIELMKSWAKPTLAVSLTACCMLFIACSIPSVQTFLDKPIPTGSMRELIAFAAGAILIASLLVGGALTIYLGIRFARHLRAEQRAKAMAKEIIERIASKELTSSAPSRHLVKILH